MLGEKISQTALLFGADDLDGTIIEEKITHSAGAMTGEGMTRDDLIYLIRKAGRHLSNVMGCIMRYGKGRIPNNEDRSARSSQIRRPARSR